MTVIAILAGVLLVAAALWCVAEARRQRDADKGQVSRQWLNERAIDKKDMDRG